MSTQQYSDVREAILRMNFEQLDFLLAAGLTLNFTNGLDETLFADILDELLFDKSPHTGTIAQELLKRGADPNFRNSKQRSALSVVMLNMATDVLRLLLEAGANPNDEAGFDEGESFYEYAAFDYLHQVYDHLLPEQPIYTDTTTPETWLQFLDRLAVKYKRRRPDHLFLLREFGAKTMQERAI